MPSCPLKEEHQTLLIFIECLLWAQGSYESMWNKKYFYFLCFGYECTSSTQEIIANKRTCRKTSLSLTFKRELRGRLLGEVWFRH